MPKYMLILHEPAGRLRQMSPEERAGIAGNAQIWLEQMRSSGRYVVSEKLQEEGGKVVSLRNGQPAVIDGPYIESKEVIGGFFTIRAADYDEAVKIASGSPFLELGPVIVRQTDSGGCGDKE